MKRSRTSILVECALMVALATLLGYIKLFDMPMGGSITLASMAPLAICSYRNGAKWGLMAAATHGLIQMILGINNVLYCTTLLAMAGCIILDYILAFAVMGLACVFTFGVKNRIISASIGTAAVCFLRLICSFLSGILIWGDYAPESQPVWLYSLQYNAGYMIPETIITVISVAAILKITEKKSSAA